MGMGGGGEIKKRRRAGRYGMEKGGVKVLSIANLYTLGLHICQDCQLFIHLPLMRQKV
jgi:hypothetical protein